MPIGAFVMDFVGPLCPKWPESADSTKCATKASRQSGLNPFRPRLLCLIDRGCRPMVKVTYYLEVISSWCYWAEPAWLELNRRFAGRVEFGWKIALMPAEALPVSKNQCEWFYRRSGTITRSPFMLNSGWLEPDLKEYPV